MSYRSFSFSAGRMIVLMPARWAPRTFVLIPPTGSTFPRRVISPVIAVSARHNLPVRSDAIAVAMVTPAEGPSLGTAPAGTCRWISQPVSSFGSRPRAA